MGQMRSAGRMVCAPVKHMLPLSLWSWIVGKWQTIHRQMPRDQRWDRHVAGATAAVLRGDLGGILMDTLAVEGEAAESASRRK